MKIIKKAIVFGTLFALSQTASAHCMVQKYYVGGGVAFNSLSAYDDATGFQVLGGYSLDFKFKSPRSKTSVEVGYMDFGQFSQEVVRFPGNPNRPRVVETETRSLEGLWAAGVGEYHVDRKLHLLGRLGFDAGDDDGLLFGIGMALNFSRYAQIRGEYVQRDETESIQMNWISEF